MKLNKYILTFSLCLIGISALGQHTFQANSFLRFKLGVGFTSQSALGQHYVHNNLNDLLINDLDTAERLISSYLIQLPLQAEFWPVYNEQFGLGFNYSHTLGAFVEATSNSRRFGPRAYYSSGKYRFEASWASMSQRFSFRKDSLIDLNRYDFIDANVFAKGSMFSISVQTELNDESFLKLTYINESFKTTSSALPSNVTQNGFSLSYDKIYEYEIRLTYFPKYSILEDSRNQSIRNRLNIEDRTFQLLQFQYFRNIDVFQSSK